MKTIRRVSGYAIAASLAFSSLTWANTSVLDEEEKSPFTLRYLADAIGTSIGRPSSLYPTPEGQDAGTTTITNYVYFLYYLNEKQDVYVGFVPRYSIQPVRGFDVALLDPRVRIKWANILANEGSPFTMGLRLRTAIPVTESSRDKDLVITPTATLYPKYAIPDSRWTLQLPIHTVTYFYSGEGTAESVADVNKQKDVAFVMSPAVSYKVSSKFRTTLEYNLSAAHYRLDPLGDFFEDGTDLVAYFEWQATEALSVTPKLTFYPGANLNADSTTIGLELYAVLY